MVLLTATLLRVLSWSRTFSALSSFTLSHASVNTDHLVGSVSPDDPYVYITPFLISNLIKVSTEVSIYQCLSQLCYTCNISICIHQNLEDFNSFPSPSFKSQRHEKRSHKILHCHGNPCAYNTYPYDVSQKNCQRNSKPIQSSCGRV